MGLMRRMPLQEFAPATTGIPNNIPVEILNWNSYGRRSKWFGSAHHNAPATEQAYKPFIKYFARSTQSTRRNKKSTYFTLR